VEGRCTLRQFESLGYKAMILDVPFNVSNLDPKMYHSLQKRGCCGIKELLKLYVYTLDQEDVAIHLDTDTIMLQPMEDVFRAFSPDKATRMQSPRVILENETTRPLPDDDVSFMFLRDYMSASKITLDTSRWGVQGGMLVVRPNRTKFQEIVNVILHDTFSIKEGWGGKRFGGYWGASQVQGLLSYVYHTDPTAIELDRCIYNNMNEPMTFPKESDSYISERCTTLAPNCTKDCRKIPPERVKMAHLTLCSKPWLCTRFSDPYGLCKYFFGKWFELRRDLETNVWKLPMVKLPEKENWFGEAAQGYCRKFHKPKVTTGKYLPMQFPPL